MRNPILPSVVLFYSLVTLILAVTLIFVNRSSLLGTGARGFSNACENLVLIVIAMGVWVQRR